VLEEESAEAQRSFWDVQIRAGLRFATLTLIEDAFDVTL
jgi:hypothetical protein